MAPLLVATLARPGNRGHQECGPAGHGAQDPLYLVGRVKSLAEAVMSPAVQEALVTVATGSPRDNSRPVVALFSLPGSATGQGKMLHSLSLT